MIPVIFLSIIGLASLLAIVGIVRFCRFSTRVIAEVRREPSKSWLLTGADLLSSFVASVGVMIVASPFFLYWWIHGDPDRYLWIIRGPSPYGQFGGGPFQLFMYSGLFLIGLSVVGVGLSMRWWFWRKVEEKALRDAGK